jgi:CubicO group peptidase (beta-lactamase class C family)
MVQGLSPDALKGLSKLSGIHDLKLNLDVIQKHVIRPNHVIDVVSSRGIEEGTPIPTLKLPKAPTYHLDVDGFGKALHGALKDAVVGYVMRIRQKGNTIYTLQWNWSKTPADGGTGWSPSVPMHIASCSKLITGIAMTKLLNDKSKSFDTPIIGYLPKYWSKGQNVNKITFRHLMTHTSGFLYGVKTSASDFETMKAQVAAGVTNLGKAQYQNMNFGLCRILIATMNGNVSPEFTIPVTTGPLPGMTTDMNDVVWDALAIQAYVQYVQDRVFKPSGVSVATLAHTQPNALAYTFPAGANGWNSGDLSSVSGGAGWHVSVDDLLNVMGTLRRKGTIMSTAHAQAMLDAGFGIDVRASTPLGLLYNKNGAWGDKDGRIEQSLAYFLPEDMELVVLANSPVVSTDKLFRDFVTELYMANIKPT